MLLMHSIKIYVEHSNFTMLISEGFAGVHMVTLQTIGASTKFIWLDIHCKVKIIFLEDILDAALMCLDLLGIFVWQNYPSLIWRTVRPVLVRPWELNAVAPKKGQEINHFN